MNDEECLAHTHVRLSSLQWRGATALSRTNACEAESRWRLGMLALPDAGPGRHPLTSPTDTSATVHTHSLNPIRSK